MTPTKEQQELIAVNWGRGRHLTEKELTIVKKYGRARLVIEGRQIKAIREYEPGMTTSCTTKFEAWYDDFIGKIVPELGDYYIGRFIDCGFEPFLFLQVLEQEGKLKRCPVKKLKN